jgi:quercetin dioxygenase-like cupin family protein
MGARIEVVRGSAEKASPGQPFGGQAIFDVPGIHVGLSRLAPGAVTAWHHHAACEFYAYVIEGTITLESGPGGRSVTTASAGEFVRIPPGLVHRDLNRTGATVLVAAFCVGPPPFSVPVDTPEAETSPPKG